MRVTEKLQLVENIALELQKRYTYEDVNLFLSEFNVLPAMRNSYNSKKEYIKERIGGIKGSELKKIAEELNLAVDNIVVDPPANWSNTSSVKAFICHLAKNKDVAIRLRDVLAINNIECFVAHEDIRPSEEWQKEIDRALRTMDFFISIHTEGFSDSIWCQQEIGYAVCRAVKIIPVKFDEDPEGFIGKIQALHRGKKNAEVVAKDILAVLETDPKTKDFYNEKVASTRVDVDDIPF